MKIIKNVVKLFTVVLVLNTVTSKGSLGQTAQVKQASNTANAPASGTTNKTDAATLNNNKVKMVDKKKRKANHVTTIKRNTDSAQNQKK